MGKNWKLMKAASRFCGMARPRLARGVVWWCLAVIALLTACTTGRAPSGPGTTQSKITLAQLEPGPLMIAALPQLAAISYDPPNARTESASEGAGTAVRKVLNTPNLGQPQLEAVVGILEFTLTPFAAVYGAARASQQRLSADKLAEAQQHVEQALRSNAGAEVLRDKVAEVAHQQTHRQLMCIGSASAVPASSVPVSAVLELAVEQLRLKVAKAGHNQYFLVMEARARLRRSADGAVLLDRLYHYESGPAMWVDWSRQGGLEPVAQTGYQALAERIAGDIFQPLAEPPLLIGPGQKHTSLRRSSAAAREGTRSTARRPCVLTRRTCRPGTLTRRASRPDARTRRFAGSAELRPLQGGASRAKAHLVLCQAPPTPPPRRKEPPTAEDPVAKVVDLSAEKMAPVEVYPGQPDERLREPASVAAVEGNAEGKSQTQWALDGLENDRNFVVQVGACLGAIPMGLWENTVGAALEPGRKKTAKLVLALAPLPAQEHFAEALTDEVARCLRSQVLNPVRRTEEPPQLATSLAGEATTTTSGGAQTNCPLALQIQVVDAKLVGKRENSRSRALCVEIQATVLRTLDGQELYCRPVLYRSTVRNLKDWTAADAKLFRQELKACSQQAAQALSGDLIRHGFVTPGSVPLDGQGTSR